jgi:two-component system alkaline phosphatase synthesis response regulator PhoP
MTNQTILVIDDDAAILDMISQVLLDEGYEVVTASNGRTAIHYAVDYLPRLILLDLMMPEMNGWQVIEELRKYPETLSIPVILLSARREMANVASALEVSNYLEKPFDLDVLITRVETVLSSPDSAATLSSIPI